MIKDIRYHPDEILRRVCDPVTGITPAVQALMDDLLETMLSGGRGIGIAAPQIGVPERVIVVAPIMARGEIIEANNCLVMANPKIIWQSIETKPFTEACLSLPSTEIIRGEVIRPAAVRVSYLDRQGEAQEFESDGVPAVVLQHEIDHLDGILFPDRLPEPARIELYQSFFAQSERNLG